MKEIVEKIGASAINLGVVESTTEEMFYIQAQIVLNNEPEVAIKLLSDLL